MPDNLSMSLTKFIKMVSSSDPPFLEFGPTSNTLIVRRVVFHHTMTSFGFAQLALDSHLLDPLVSGIVFSQMLPDR